MNKIIIIGVLAALIAGSIVGSYIHADNLFAKLEAMVAKYGSPSGSTYATPNQVGIVAQPLTGAATTTSILNPIGSDAVITAINIGCEALGTSRTYPDTGTGLASFTVKAATTSVASLGLQNNTNTVGGTMTIATSSATFVLSTTTPAVAGNLSFADIWPANTYLTFLFNATNTADCNVGVSYIGL